MKITPHQSRNAPRAAGGYSQAVSLEGHERLVFVSGQVPEDSAGRISTDFDGQCRQVWANVEAQLHEAGLGLRQVVQVTTYLASRDHAEDNSRIRREILGDHHPALTVLITGIYDERWLLEIEAIAAG